MMNKKGAIGMLPIALLVLIVILGIGYVIGGFSLLLQILWRFAVAFAGGLLLAALFSALRKKRVRLSR